MHVFFHQTFFFVHIQTNQIIHLHFICLVLQWQRLSIDVSAIFVNKRFFILTADRFLFLYHLFFLWNKNKLKFFWKCQNVVQLTQEVGTRTQVNNKCKNYIKSDWNLCRIHSLTEENSYNVLVINFKSFLSLKLFFFNFYFRISTRPAITKLAWKCRAWIWTGSCNYCTVRIVDRFLKIKLQLTQYFFVYNSHAGYSYCGECGGFAYRQISPAVVWVIFFCRFYFSGIKILLLFIAENEFSFWDLRIMFVFVDVHCRLLTNVKLRCMI